MSPTVRGVWRRWWQPAWEPALVTRPGLPGVFLLHRPDRDEIPEAPARRALEALRARPHPHVLTVFDHDELDGATAWVTAAAPGEPLRQVLRRACHTRAAYPLGEAARLVRELCEGLTHVRAGDLTRAALDPLDASLGVDGMVLLSPWGWGVPHPTAVLGRVRVAPQVHGAAPEFIRGERTDARAEVWSLGVALYEAVFAEHAFPGDSDVDRLMRVLSREPPARLRDPAGVPPALFAVLRGALAFDPAQRFASPDALAVALDPIAAFAPAPPVYRTDPRAALAAAADAQDLPRAAALLCATPELLDDGLARWLWRRLAAPLLDALRDGHVEIHDAVLAVLLRRVIAADLRALRADARTRLGARDLLDAICDDADLPAPQWDRRVRLGLLEVDACARAWESLRPTDDPAVRHCDACAQTVTEVRGVGALSSAGRCARWRED